MNRLARDICWCLKSGKPLLILIQGAPGAGKTTMAKKLSGILHIPYFEADMWFSRHGKYQFISEELGKAHYWCFSKVKKNLENGKSVICSNTLTTDWEVENYINLAKQFDANYYIIRLLSDYGTIHGTPPEAIERLKDNLRHNTIQPNIVIS